MIGTHLKNIQSLNDNQISQAQRVVKFKLRRRYNSPSIKWLNYEHSLLFLSCAVILKTKDGIMEILNLHRECRNVSFERHGRNDATCPLNDLDFPLFKYIRNRAKSCFCTLLLTPHSFCRDPY